LPGLSLSLHRVFWVMGGYTFAAGRLTAHVAQTAFRARARGAVGAVALTGLASIGWMAVVNFIIASDFRWLLLAFILIWILALVLCWLEGRGA
jgi:hypothetical protein